MKLVTQVVTMPLVSAAKSDAVFAEADGAVSLHYHRVGEKTHLHRSPGKNGKANCSASAVSSSCSCSARFDLELRG